MYIILSIHPSIHGWLHVSTLDIQWYICTSISCSSRGIMPLHCCQRPSSWRKQGQAQGRVKVSFFIWMRIPCTLGSQFLYVLCLILISFTMFQSWLSVTAQLQTSRFNSKLSTWAESCAKWPLVAESHTCIMSQVRRIHICHNHVPSQKCQNMVCIMLHHVVWYHNIPYHIISYPIFRQTHIIHLRQLRAVQGVHLASKPIGAPDPVR